MCRIFNELLEITVEKKMKFPLRVVHDSDTTTSNATRITPATTMKKSQNCPTMPLTQSLSINDTQIQTDPSVQMLYERAASATGDNRELLSRGSLTAFLNSAATSANIKSLIESGFEGTISTT